MPIRWRVEKLCKESRQSKLTSAVGKGKLRGVGTDCCREWMGSVQADCKSDGRYVGAGGQSAPAYEQGSNEGRLSGRRPSTWTCLRRRSSARRPSGENSWSHMAHTWTSNSRKPPCCPTRGHYTKSGWATEAPGAWATMARHWPEQRSARSPRPRGLRTKAVLIPMHSANVPSNMKVVSKTESESARGRDRVRTGRAAKPHGGRPYLAWKF